MASSCRVTAAQATTLFLKDQYVEGDGTADLLFGGCFRILDHASVAGIGAALQEQPNFPYHLPRSAMVQTAVAFAKMIAGGLRVKLAVPDGEVFVPVGDGSYLMLAKEFQAAIQILSLNIVLLDSLEFTSIGFSQRANVKRERHHI